MSSSAPLPHPSNTSAFQHEWPVLLACASPFPETLKLPAMLRAADAERLVALAEEHGVVGHVAASLGKLDRAVFPPELRPALRNRQHAQAVFSLLITAELFRVLDRFVSERIGALVVKGPVLSVQAYGDPGMRRYGDLDLLVRQRDIRRARELMIAAGYESRVPLRAIAAGKIPGQYLFSKPEKKLIVELHNERTLRYFPRRLPIEECFARQIRVPLDGHEVPALSLEDELVLVSIHGAKHFWDRLLWIADVAALVSRQTGIDWERVRSSAKAVGAERMLHTGLRLASDLLQAKLPEHVQAMVQADVAAARLAKETRQWLPAAGYAPMGLVQRAALRWRMRGGLVAAPGYLLRLSFSPTEEDWKEGSPQEFLAMVRRPFRLAQKYGGAKKS